MKRTPALILLICSLLAASASAREWIALFGTEECDQCQAVKAEWTAQEKGADIPVLLHVSIDRDENYYFLKRVEERLGYAGAFDAFPVALRGAKMAAGADGFWKLAEMTPEPLEEGARALLAPLQEAADRAAGNAAVWNAAAAKEEETDAAGRRRGGRLLYLASPGCQKCARQEVELRLLKESRPDVAIDSYLVTTDEGLLMMARVMRRFGLPEDGRNLAPLVAWETGYVTGRLAPCEELALALDGLEAGAAPFWEGDFTEKERQALRSRYSRFLNNATLWTSLYAGLLDGINPCAFATVIFLISYLLYLKRGRRFVLTAGLLFCAGVFASYLLFGVGLSFIVDVLGRLPLVKQLFYWAFALTGLVFAALHLRDALRYRRTGRASDMEMGLDAGTHRKIHDRIHRWAALTGWIVMPATVLLGVVVSGMEFVCTGQVYLPTIIAINASGFNLRAFGWLVLYNAAFIVPLLAVTVLAYFGIGAKALASFAKDHVFATKLLMAAFFLAMGILMLLLATGKIGF